jgi:hypothetical protein
MLVLAGKLLPTTSIDVPAGPLDGEVEMVGPVAVVDEKGTAKARITSTIVTVAARSRQVVASGAGDGVASGTHLLPSQKDMRLLHSATRLTR